MLFYRVNHFGFSWQPTNNNIKSQYHFWQQSVRLNSFESCYTLCVVQQLQHFHVNMFMHSSYWLIANTLITSLHLSFWCQNIDIYLLWLRIVYDPTPRRILVWVGCIVCIFDGFVQTYRSTPYAVLSVQSDESFAVEVEFRVTFNYPVCFSLFVANFYRVLSDVCFQFWNAESRPRSNIQVISLEAPECHLENC